MFLKILHNTHGINIDDNFHTGRGELLLSAVICNNISKEIKYSDISQINSNEIVMNRRHGTFSFSVGMIF